MVERRRSVTVIGGGTSGAVMAARLSEDPGLRVLLLEAGPDHDAYDDGVLDPGRAPDSWSGRVPNILRTRMATETGALEAMQARVLGGTSAYNGLATLRGQPADYDAWAAAGLEGWSWREVESTFIKAERDMDFPDSPIHGADGPLPVRRWRRDEMSAAQAAFLDGMIETGQAPVDDINDPRQLPGVGVFPVTIDKNARRVTTSLAYLDEATRARENLEIRTGAEVARIEIENGRARGVALKGGAQIESDEVVVTAGAIWSAALLLRSGVGPAKHLAEHGLAVHADLPVGSTMSDHLGAAVFYRHQGPRGGAAGPAQAVFVGASSGEKVDYHLMPVSLHDPARQPLTFREKLRFLTEPGHETPRPGLKTLLSLLRFLAQPSRDATLLAMTALLLVSSGRGSVRLGATPEAEPVVTAPPLPPDGYRILRHAFDRMAAWERSSAFKAAGLEQVFPIDLASPTAVEEALALLPASYFHMVGTCPMGTVLDADCRVRGVPNLRVADAAVMPSIPAGNTYLGCVMVAERIAAKMKRANCL